MTRRIKRQRHRRRRSGSAHDPVDASQGDQEPHEAYELEAEDDAPEPRHDADLEDAVDVGPEERLYEVPDSSVTTETVRSGAEDPGSEELAEDLEDTAADPALERGAAPRPSRSPVERPDTDGAPVIEESMPEPAPAHEDPDHPEAFGRWLRSQRELRGIHLRAIAESSKISLGHLKALEAGRFDLLPADVFTKGFLRQYAGYVGLDPEETINFYLAARDHVEEEEDPLGVKPPPKESGTRWVLVALILTTVLVGVIWGLSRLSESPDGAADAPSGTEQPTRAADAAADDTASDGGAGDGAVDPAPGESGNTAGDRVDDGPDGSADAAAGSLADSSAESPAPRPQPTAPTQSVQPADVPLRIVLDFSDTCWVSALIDGSETREKVHAQGESLTLDARSSVELKVGNYRAVEVEVNGMPYDLGSRGRSGSVVRTVLIDLESVRELAQWNRTNRRTERLADRMSG